MANQNSNPGGQGGKSSAGERADRRSGAGIERRSGSGREGERGFAGMDPKQQREIASEGGRAAHEKGTAHEFTSEEARQAGRKGGEATAKHRSQGGKSPEKSSTRPASGARSGTGQEQPGSGRKDH